VLGGVVEHDRADAVGIDRGMQLIASGVHDSDGSKGPMNWPENGSGAKSDG
jgi:hypothetical protein